MQVLEIHEKEYKISLPFAVSKISKSDPLGKSEIQCFSPIYRANCPTWTEHFFTGKLWNQNISCLTLSQSHSLTHLLTLSQLKGLSNACDE